MRYRRTQIGYLTTCVLFCAAIVAAVTGLLAPTSSESLLIRAIIEVILFVSVIVFSSLTITIDDEKLIACFTLGLVCKRVRAAELPNANRFASAGGTDGEFISRLTAGCTTSRD